jgi:CheY-like chemotaxis protein
MKLLRRPLPRPDAPRPKPAATRRRPRVLLIDPDAPSREVESLLVRYYGFDVQSAPDAAEGLHLARSDEPPDAIVCELFTDGVERGCMVAALKANPATAAVPVLVVSSHALPEEQARARAAGAVSFLPKPVRGDRLREELVRVLGEPPARAEIAARIRTRA